ncbi:hypothetical protein, partial [Methanohalobium sp.]|uniref:hypothetical protein n=1 Tax=Methanohalobium sp. TaxID=2837493 RepID=UPI0025F78A1E
SSEDAISTINSTPCDIIVSLSVDMYSVISSLDGFTKIVCLVEEDTSAELYTKFSNIFEFQTQLEEDKDENLTSVLFHRKNMFGKLEQTKHVLFENTITIDSEKRS